MKRPGVITISLGPRPAAEGLLATSKQIDVKARMRALREQNTEKWSVSGLTLVIGLTLFVAAVALVLALVQRQKRIASERRRRAAGEDARKGPAARNEHIRYGLRDQDALPAEITSENHGRTLREGAGVVIFDPRPGGGAHEGRVIECYGNDVIFNLTDGSRLMTDSFLVARRHHDSKLDIHAFRLAMDKTQDMGGLLQASLDREEPTVRIHAAGLFSITLEALLFAPLMDGSHTGVIGEDGTCAALRTSITHLGLTRVRLSESIEVPEEESFAMRCLLPGETESIEMRVRRRKVNMDTLGSPVTELAITDLTPADQARLLRHLRSRALSLLLTPASPDLPT